VSGSVERRPDLVPPRRDFMPMVLVVEDDDVVRESIANVARDGGYLVVEAKNSDEALRALTTGGISVALIDLQLPGSMDGFGLARHVAATWPDVSLIITSGWVLPLPGALPQGSEFLSKPFREADLAKVLMAAA
jgi:CheY-like chemotaxis protein